MLTPDNPEDTSLNKEERELLLKFHKEFFEELYKIKEDTLKRNNYTILEEVQKRFENILNNNINILTVNSLSIIKLKLEKMIEEYSAQNSFYNLIMHLNDKINIRMNKSTELVTENKIKIEKIVYK